MDEPTQKFPDAYQTDKVASDDDISGHGITWSDQEEKKLVRKLDLIVMPLLILGFFGLQLDRGNISNALTDNFLKDVGITQDQFNVGQQLLSVGIVVLEIPSNLVLYVLGPRAWIGGQIIVWGFIALFQAFQKGYGAFLATRLLLGLAESGFIPASLWAIAQFYRRSETSKRFSLFFWGNMFALASSGLIAFGILRMRGVCNLGGWQWLFIIEGLFTILVGILFVALFPKDPSHPVSFLGLKYFNDREAMILQQRVLRDDPSKIKTGRTITGKEIKDTLANWRIYPHLLIAISGIAPATALGTYAPTLIANYGYGKLKSNALVSVGWWVQIVLNFALGYTADATRQRGLCTLLGLSLFWGFCLGNLILDYSKSKSSKYALLLMAQATENIWHPINGSWLALNSRSPAERSITMALYIMFTNASGIYGGQIFRSNDSPHYHRAWSAIVAVVSVAVASCIFANIMYRVLNRKSARLDVTEGTEDAHEAAVVDSRLRYQI